MPPETSPGEAASTTSDTLASYVTDYRTENGRRYHAYQDGSYWVGRSLLFAPAVSGIDSIPGSQ